MSLIELKNVSKIYTADKVSVPALLNIDLEINEGEFLAITGPSGSGKSTLMNIIGLLDRPTEGELHIDGEVMSLNMSDRKLARLRNRKIGFVFQSFSLLPRLNALQNVLLPTAYSNSKNERIQRAQGILTKLGLGKRMRHRPSELSGGEKQRVAIARALITGPSVVLADEPTGNLDSKSGLEIMAVLQDLNKREGKTIIMITHNQNLAKQCGREIKLLDGKIVEEK